MGKKFTLGAALLFEEITGGSVTDMTKPRISDMLTMLYAQEYWDNDNSVERLKYIINANDNNKAIVTLLWDNVLIRFEVDTMSEKHLENFANTLK